MTTPPSMNEDARPGPLVRFMQGPMVLAAERPGLTLLLAVVISLMALLSSQRLRPSASLSAILGQNDPAAVALNRVIEDFSAVDELLLLVTASDSTPAPDAARKLIDFSGRLSVAVKDSPEAAKLIAGVVSRADDQMIEYFKTQLVPSGLYYLDDATFAAFVERLKPESMRAQIRQNETMISAPGPGAEALSKALLQDPLRMREFLQDKLKSVASPFRTWRDGQDFVSADGRAMLIRVQGRKPANDLPFAKAITAAVQSITEHDPALSSLGLKVEYSGAYAIAAEGERSIRHDMVWSIFGSIVCFQILFLAAYRNVLAFPLAFIPTLTGVLTAFGIFALFTPNLTPMTAVLGAMLAGMGLEYAIYYLSHYESARAEGLAIIPAIRQTNGLIGPAISAASATSIIGFLAIAQSTVRSLRDFAVLGSIGLAFTALATLIIVPAILVLLERFAPRLLNARGSRFGLRGVAPRIARRPRLFATPVALVALAGVAFILITPRGLVGFEPDLRVMHPRPNPPLDVQEKIADRFGAVAESLLVHVAAASDDELVSRTHALEAALANPAIKAAGVARTFSIASLLPNPANSPARAAQLRAIDAEHVVKDFMAAIDDSAFDAKAYEGYAGFLRRILGPEPPPNIGSLWKFPSLASNFLPKLELPPDKTRPAAQAITIALVEKPINDRATRERLVNTMRAATAQVPGTTVTGLPVLGQDAEAAVRRDLPPELLVAGVLVLVYILIYFRSITDTALATLPVAAGTVGLLVYSAVFNEHLNLANMVAIPLLFGMGADYGIFCVSIARQCRPTQRGDPRGESQFIDRMSGASHAFLMNSLTIILGFGSLALTGTPAIQSLGRVTSIGIAGVLLATAFLLLPLLLTLFRRRSRIAPTHGD